MLRAIFGISGYKLTKQEKELFSQTNPHGIILFKRNCENKDQIIALNKEIKSLIPGVKIFIDQEGGRVARIKPPIAEKEFPNMEFFAKISDDKDIDTAIVAVEQNFFELMSELKSLGIDVTCAPVCDLRHKDAHDIVGDRSFGSNVETVTLLCKAVLNGIHRAGGEGVLKHIPGHGRAKADSHHDLPIVKADLEDLENTDFKVFKNLANYCSYAMTAHIIYNCLDPDLPVTISPKAIKYIRDEIGFKGMLMSDDICMKALYGSIIHRTVASLNSGCDLVLHCDGNINDMEDVKLALQDFPKSMLV